MKRYGRPRRKSRNNSGNWRSRKNVRFLNKILRDVYEFFYWQQSEKNKYGIDYELAGMVNPKYNPCEFPPEMNVDESYLYAISAQNLPDE